MKVTFAVTDVAGPIGNLVARKLLQAGYQVRLVEQRPQYLENFLEEGAEPCICDLTDPHSLGACFADVAGVYLALPTWAKYHDDCCALMDRVSEAFAEAIVTRHVCHVVTQSNLGAAPGGNPLLASWYTFEQRLNQIAAANVLHVRPSHLPENLGMEILPSLNVLVGAIDPNRRIPIIAPEDVASFVVERLEKRDFVGHQTRELLGLEDLSMRDVARIMGQCINKRNISYVQLDAATMQQWLLRVGLPQAFAVLANDAWDLINRGLLEPHEPRSAQNTTSTSLESLFARDIALYAQQKRAAGSPIYGVAAANAGQQTGGQEQQTRHL